MEFEASEGVTRRNEMRLRMAQLHILFQDWKPVTELLFETGMSSEGLQFQRESALAYLQLVGARTGDGKAAAQVEFRLSEERREPTVFVVTGPQPNIVALMVSYLQGEEATRLAQVQAFIGAPAMLAREVFDRAMLFTIVDAPAPAMELCDKILRSSVAEPADRCAAHLLKAYLFLRYRKLVEAQHQLMSAQALLTKVPDDDFLTRFSAAIEPRVGW